MSHILIVSKFRSCRNSIANIILNKDAFKTSDLPQRRSYAKLYEAQDYRLILSSYSLDTIYDVLVEEQCITNLLVIISGKASRFLDEDESMCKALIRMVPDAMFMFIAEAYIDDVAIGWLKNSKEGLEKELEGFSVDSYSIHSKSDKERIKEHIDKKLSMNVKIESLSAIKRPILMKRPIAIIHKRTGMFMNLRHSFMGDFTTLTNYSSPFYINKCMQKDGCPVLYRTSLTIESRHTNEIMYETSLGNVEFKARKKAGCEAEWIITPCFDVKGDIIFDGDEVFIYNAMYNKDAIRLSSKNVECGHCADIWIIKNEE